VRLGPSTPGDYVRARVLVPRNPGVTKVEPTFFRPSGIRAKQYISKRVMKLVVACPPISYRFGDTPKNNLAAT
jgi:hypothetical protein